MSFLALRFLFGIAMGGEWGIGSALTFETIPTRARGIVSGLLQAGYPSGYFVASIATYFFYDTLGWRYMFLLGVAPAILVFFVRMGVDESPAFLEKRIKKEQSNLVEVLARNWKIALYAIILMTAFNFFSHGSHKMLTRICFSKSSMDSIRIAYSRHGRRHEYRCDPGEASASDFCRNVSGASAPLSSQPHCGRCRSFRSGLSVRRRLGSQYRRFFSCRYRCRAPGASSRCISMNFPRRKFAQHFQAWSYQLGNFIASRNLPIQVGIAEAHGNNYGLAMAMVIGTVVVVIILLVVWGPERRGVAMADAQREAAPA